MGRVQVHKQILKSSIFGKCCHFTIFRALKIGGFPIGVKTKIRYLIFCCFHNFSLVRDLKIILIFHPHYHTHSGNTSRLVNLTVVRWLVSYEDENEYGNDNGNEIED